MNRPPRKLPMDKPLPAKPVPQKPGGFGDPSRQPGFANPRSKGPSILLILLAVFGGIGFILLLACGGFAWYVSSDVQKELAKQNRPRVGARRHSNESHHQPGSPSRPAPSGQPIKSVSSAIAGLNGSSLSRRKEAIQYLANQPVEPSRRQEVVSKTLPLLSDRHRAGDAALVLTKWARASDAAQLANAAEAAHARADRNTQKNIVQILVNIGSTQAPEHAARYYSTKHDVVAARRMFESLGHENAAYLLPHLNDQDASLRNTTRDLLKQWEVDDRLLVEQCLNDLQSGNRYQMREATTLLQEYVIVDTKLSPQVSNALISLLTDRQIRPTAAAALQYWVTPENVPALIELANVAHAANDRIAQRECVKLLTRLNDQRALPTYATYLQTQHDRTVAKAAFTAIGPPAAKTLVPLVNDEKYSVRQMARELIELWKVGDSRLQQQELQDLASGDYNRQREAIRSLSKIEPDNKTKSAIAAALVKLVDDRRLRHNVLNLLPKWSTTETVPQLIVLLKHEDRFVQSHARQSLVATKDPRAVFPLAEGFSDDFFKRTEARRNLIALGPIAETALWPHVNNENWQVAKDACEALQEIGTKKSIPILEGATRHSHSFVKRAAESALNTVRLAKREPVSLPASSEETDDGTRKMRTWVDATGNKRIEALFIEFAAGKVRLRTKNGQFLSLKLNQLSPADQQYVMRQLQR